MDDVLLNKASIIERCIRRVREEFAGDAKRLENFTHQDAIVLNLERACQAAIDMAMRVVAERHLGAPQSSAQAFDFLSQAGLIPGGLAQKLRAMAGLRNVAVRQYRSLDMDILRQVVERGPALQAHDCGLQPRGPGRLTLQPRRVLQGRKRFLAAPHGVEQKLHLRRPGVRRQ